MQLVGCGVVIGNKGAAVKYRFQIARPFQQSGNVPCLPLGCCSGGVLHYFCCCSSAFSLG